MLLIFKLRGLRFYISQRCKGFVSRSQFFRYIFLFSQKFNFLNPTDTAVTFYQLKTRQRLDAERKRFSKSTNFYQREVYISVSQRVSHVRQALPVHLDLEDTTEPGDEEEREEGLETREIKVLWDRQESAASKVLWGL